MTDPGNEQSDESDGGIDRTALAITLVVLFMVGFVGLEVFTAVMNPDTHCREYGDDYTGEWVNESEPPQGEYGIVCTAPNGTTINDTVKEANAA